MAKNLETAAKKLYAATKNSTNTPPYIEAFERIAKVAKGLGSSDEKRNKKLLETIKPDARLIATKLYLAKTFNDCSKELLKIDWSSPSDKMARERNRELIATAVRTGRDSKDSAAAIKTAIASWNAHYEECLYLASVADKIGKFALAFSKSCQKGPKAAKTAKDYVGSYVARLDKASKSDVDNHTKALATTIGMYEKEVAEMPMNFAMIATFGSSLSTSCAVLVRDALAELGALRAGRF